MRPSPAQVPAVVWGCLVLATLLTWWIGADHGIGTGAGAGLVIVAVCFVKIRLVGIHFMELGRSPVVLRGLFEGYVLVVATTLAVLYLAT